MLVNIIPYNTKEYKLIKYGVIMFLWYGAIYGYYMFSESTCGNWVEL